MLTISGVDTEVKARQRHFQYGNLLLLSMMATRSSYRNKAVSYTTLLALHKCLYLHSRNLSISMRENILWNHHHDLGDY